MRTAGTLTVVGAGYRIGGHITVEAESHIRYAEKVFTAVAPGVHEWMRELNASAESLLDCYAEGKRRGQTYRQMTHRILAAVRAGHRTCAVFYGHPGVACAAGHASIRRARKEGFRAVMLPGISAEDCLFADLGIDPSHGLQSFEATDFLMRRRASDPACALILWQIGAVGEYAFRNASGVWNSDAFKMLVRKLTKSYSPKHRVTIYQASPIAGCAPMIRVVPLSKLEHAPISISTTLYVPPSKKPELNWRVVDRINGMRNSDNGK